MKKVAKCLIIGILVFSGADESGAIYYNDGGVHTIDSHTTGYVVVGNSTTVNLVSGGLVEFGVQVWGNSEFNMSGGVNRGITGDLGCSGNFFWWDDRQVDNYLRRCDHHIRWVDSRGGDQIFIYGLMTTAKSQSGVQDLIIPWGPLLIQVGL